MTPTPEHAQTFGDLWRSGLTAGQIVSYFNGMFNRNQVMGRLFRMGLLGFRAPIKSKPTRPKTRRARPVRPLPFKPSPAPIPAGAAGRSFNGDCGPCYDIVKLKRGDCRFPLGDPGKPDFCYCAAPIFKGSYCFHHAQIAYIPRHSR